MVFSLLVFSNLNRKSMEAQSSFSNTVPLREDFLQYLWNFQLFRTSKLFTASGVSLKILKTGMQNKNSGPDFFNAKLVLGEQTWVGNVEVHIKSSDWYAHQHEKDPNYDAVILHVVWEYDLPVFRSNGLEMETLELRNNTDLKVLNSYLQLFLGRQKWILCERELPTVPSIVKSPWIARLYVERFERKSLEIAKLLKESSNNWELVLFQLLAKSFGLHTNVNAFSSLAHSFDFSLINKLRFQSGGIETLLFGQAGFFEGPSEDHRYREMQKEYRYLKHKHHLKPLFSGQFQFFRLRPANFPTLRISQLACLYEREAQLFSQTIRLDDLSSFRKLFAVTASDYWNTHYVFEKTSPFRIKKTTNSFTDLLLINTILPIKFAHAKAHRHEDFDIISGILEQIKPEKNKIIENFRALKITAQNAMESQALLELKNNYCSHQRCLECAVGLFLIKGEKTQKR
jgi:hypothetical protein